MYIVRLLLLLFATTFSSSSAKQAAVNKDDDEPVFASLKFPQLPDNKYGAALFALLYSYPFASYSKAFGDKLGLSALGTNGFFHFTKTSTAGDDTVVRPNVDTIYGISILDLAEQDIIVTIPPMQPDRYYLYAFYDPFGDNYASVGSVHWDKPGKYLVRPSLGTGRAGLSAKDCENYAGCIDAPTLNGLLLVRVELKNQSTDVRYVNHYLDQIAVKKGIKHSPPLAPPLKPSDLSGLSKQISTRSLQLVGRMGDRNPPQNPILATTLPWVLKYAGVDSDGNFSPPPSVNMTDVESTFQTMIRKFASSPENNIPLNNGWSYLNPSFSGSFNAGKNLVARSFVARFAYLLNTADQAIYPTPSRKVFHLANDEAYLLTFSGKPPVSTSGGFWSITVYDSHGFLIKTPQEIYALGDRSKLIYPDGELVYGQDKDASGRPFQILIQSAEVKPPANWTSNWLPSPSSGNGFQLTMRLYAPLDAATSGEYQYPIFKKQKALRTKDSITGFHHRDDRAKQPRRS